MRGSFSAVSYLSKVLMRMLGMGPPDDLELGIALDRLDLVGCEVAGELVLASADAVDALSDLGDLHEA